MALCTKAKELLRELQRSDWLPPYNVRFSWRPTCCLCGWACCGRSHCSSLSLSSPLSVCVVAPQDEQVRQVVEEVGSLHEQIMEKLRCA